MKYKNNFIKYIMLIIVILIPFVFILSIIPISPIIPSLPVVDNNNLDLSSSSWSTVVVISDDSTGWNIDTSIMPSIAIDDNGIVHVVWMDYTDGEWGNDREILYVNYTAAGWSNVTCISDLYGWNDGNSQYPSIATDNNGILHVVWEDYTDGEWGTDTEIMYTNYTATGWSNATVISDDSTGWNNGSSYMPKIVIDNNNNLHVVWEDTTHGVWGIDNEIMYINNTGGGWSNATVISDDFTGWNDGTSIYPSIAKDKDGNLHVVWQDTTIGEWGADVEIMYANYTTSGWSNATAISDIYGWNGGSSQNPSIATDSNGNVHVVWLDNTAGEWGTDIEIMYVNYTSAGWSNATAISDIYGWNDAGSFNPDIAIDIHDNVFVVWQDDTDGEWGSDDEILYANYTGTNWSNATLISDNNTGWNDGDSLYPHIAIDKDGRLHVVWYDNTDGVWGTDTEIMYSSKEPENPIILSVLRDPINPNNLDSVNVTAHITDNYGVDTVLINSNHTGTPMDYEMDLLSGNNQDGYWNYTISAQTIGTIINYSIWVNDTYNNLATDGPYQYTVSSIWSNATVISDDITGWNIGDSFNPSIAVDIFGNVHAVWYDTTNGEWGTDNEIMYANYTESGWSNATVISDDYTLWNVGGSTYPSIATDINGNIHVVWTDTTDGEWGTDTEILYVNYTESGWSNVTAISDIYGWNNDSGFYASITTDINGNIHVVWQDETNGEWGTDQEIMYVNYTALGWSNATIISDDFTGWNNGTSRYPSISADDIGNLHVVWEDETVGEWGTDREIMYANYSGSGWSNATVISDIYGWNNDISSRPRITVDINGNLHVVWYDYTDGEWGDDVEIMYTNYSSASGWSNATVISDDSSGWNDGYSLNPRIGADSNGNIHVLWQDGTDGEWGLDYEIMYINYKGSSWSNATCISHYNGWNDGDSYFVDFGFDDNDNIHVVWQDNTDGEWGSDVEIMYSNKSSDFPNIISVSRNPINPNNLDQVIITAHITDDLGVNTVLINSNHTGTPANYEMDLLSGNNQDGYWNYTIPTYPVGTTIIYSIWVNDTDDNFDIDGPYQYKIRTILKWSNATVISDDFTGWNSDSSWYPSIAVDNNGNVHVVWQDYTNGEWGSDTEIMYANYTTTGWSNATVISDDYTGWNDGDSYGPEIAIDNNGNLHVVWYDTTDGEWGLDREIMYANYTTAGWSNATVISDDYTGWNDGDSEEPSITTDKNGNIHVVWYDATNGEWGTDDEIMYTNCSSGIWSNATCISDIYGWNNGGSWNPYLAVDNNSNIHVVWQDDTDGEWGTDWEIMYVNYNGTNWSNATAISDIYGWNVAGSYYPSIAIDNSGDIHVVFYDLTDGEWGSDVEIMYVNNTGSNWSNATVISDDYTGWNDGSSYYPNIDIDNNGNLHVVWSEFTDGEWGTDTEIMYVNYIDGSWSNATVISDDITGWNNDTSSYPKIFADKNGDIHVVWYDYTDGEWGADTEVMYVNTKGGPPKINSVSRDPISPNYEDLVNITVYITDNIGVDTVLINSNHTGTPIDYEMDFLSGNAQQGYWNYTIPAQTAGTTIIYSIWVNDTHNNFDTDGPFQYTVHIISSWTNVTVISDDFTGWNDGDSGGASIATDMNGNIHVVWEDATDGEWGTDMEIYYANYTLAGWSNVTCISDFYGWNDDISSVPSIAVDIYGNIHVVWQDYTDGEWGIDSEIMYSNYTGSGWSNATVISDDFTGWNDGSGYYAEIATDNNGNLHVVWQDDTDGEWGFDREIMYVNRTSKGWSNVTVISDIYGWNNDFSENPSITTDKNGVVHVVWEDRTNGEWGSDIEIMYTNYTAAGWSNATVISDDFTRWNNDDSRYPSITSDFAENIHVVWMDYTDGPWGADVEIMYVNYTGASWSNVTVISDIYGWNDGTSFVPSITTDNNNNLHVVWEDNTAGEWGTDFEIMYANYKGVDWSNATVLSDDNTDWNFDNSENPCIATDNIGNVYIAWQDRTNGEWGTDDEIMYVDTRGKPPNISAVSRYPADPNDLDSVNITTHITDDRGIDTVLINSNHTGSPIYYEMDLLSGNNQDGYWNYTIPASPAGTTIVYSIWTNNTNNSFNNTVPYHYNVFSNIFIWSNATAISDVYGWNDGSCSFSRIAIDNNGNLHVIWADTTPGEWGSDQEIMYANYTMAGWSNATVISDDFTQWNDDYSSAPDITIDINGVIHVVWYDRTDGEWGTDEEIFYVNYTAAGWSNVTCISDLYGWNDGNSQYPSIATDNNGIIHVVWQDLTDGEWGTDREIMYANYTAAGWSNATCISDIYGWNDASSEAPEIITDNNGDLHVVWRDDTNGEWGADIEIFYANYTSMGWSNATCISDIYGWNTGNNYNPDIAMDNNGNLHVVWEDRTVGEWGTDAEIMYINHTTSGWSNATCISDDSTGWNNDTSRFARIITDENGKLHVVWEEQTNGTWGLDTEIMYVSYPSSGWSNATVISDLYGWNNDHSYRPDIVADKYGHLHVVWFDSTNGEWGSDQEVMYVNTKGNPPNVASISRVPANPTNLDSVIITVQITDDTGVDKVLINSNHTGTPLNYEMDFLGGDAQNGFWNYTIPASPIGITISYSIWVNDTVNNFNTDGPFQYTIIDGVNPNIISVIRDPLFPNNLNTVNITVHVTDNIGVDTVLINSNHTGALINYEMDFLSGTIQDCYWNYTIPAYPAGTTVTYSIWANDTTNNPSTDGPYQYLISDGENPNIDTVFRNPFNPGNLDSVNITINITDNVGVDTVLINSNHTGTPTDYEMEFLSGTFQDGYWNYTIPAQPAGTTISYSFWVNDTSNNPDTTGPYQYTVIDNENPNIVSVSRDPFNPGNLDTVNITVRVTDNVGVDTVIINTGILEFYKMDFLSGTPQNSYWNYTIPNYTAGTIINYSIWANDTSNNNVTDGPYQYTIIDNENPNIIAVTRDPFNPGDLDTVNITCIIADNVEVDTVLINSNHTGTTYNYTMDFLSGSYQNGYWNFTIPAYPTGTRVVYSIWVNDTTNNPETDGPYQYTVGISDAVDPVIDSILIDPPGPGNLDPVNITIQVTDNVGVDTVMINSNHSGTPTDYEMDFLSGDAQDGYWNFTIPAKTAGTTIVYSFWVNDTSNNSISDGPYPYTVIDNEDPNIISVFRNPLNPGNLDSVNITVRITDNVQVDKVLLISNHTGTTDNYTMDFLSGTFQDGYWNCTIPANFAGTVINYSIWACDTTTINFDIDGPYQYTIIDNENPNIVTVSRDPSTPSDLYIVNITVYITDNVGIDTVLFNSNHTGTPTDYDMDFLSGSNQDGYWNFTIPAQAIGTRVVYSIWVNDTTNNPDTVGPYQYVVVRENPNIVLVSRDLVKPGNLDMVNITVRVTDNVGIDTVIINSNHTGTPSNYTMFPLSGTPQDGYWYYIIPSNLAGTTIDYLIIANDTNNNFNINSSFNYTIIDNEIPNIHYVTINPNPPTDEDDVIIFIWISDNVNVSKVIISHNYTGTFQNDTVNFYTGNYYDGFWLYVFSQRTVGTIINFSIWVNDTSNNINMTFSYVYTVIEKPSEPQIPLFPPGGEGGILDFLLSPLGFIIIGAIAAVSIISIAAVTRSKPKFMGIGDKNLDSKLKSLVKSKTALDFIKDKKIEDFFKKGFTTLSKTEIEKILKLDDLTDSEKIAMLKELAGMSKEERQEFLKTLENIGDYK